MLVSIITKIHQIMYEMFPCKSTVQVRFVYVFYVDESRVDENQR
jgi:hypothetical protein